MLGQVQLIYKVNVLQQKQTFAPFIEWKNCQLVLARGQLQLDSSTVSFGFEQRARARKMKDEGNDY